MVFYENTKQNETKKTIAILPTNTLRSFDKRLNDACVTDQLMDTIDTLIQFSVFDMRYRFDHLWVNGPSHQTLCGQSTTTSATKKTRYNRT